MLSVNIPLIAFGLGTEHFKGETHNTDGSSLIPEVVETTKIALDTGFRHLDLAEMYGNDREVGKALTQYLSENTFTNREDIWVTSKLAAGMAKPIEATEAMLHRLNCKYFDLLLLHCPIAFREFSKAKIPSLPTIREIWSQMETLVSTGMARRIGVSNFRIEDLKELLAVANVRPFINQIEFNPYLQQTELYEFCNQENIKLAAYSPLGSLNLWPGGPVDDVVNNLAKQYNVPASTILLKYTIQKGYVAVTTTTKKWRMVEYLSAIDSLQSQPLTAAEILAIDSGGIVCQKRKYWAECF